MTTTNPLPIAILGASGYTGGELLRLLAAHPEAKIVALSADSQAGKSVGEVHPHLAHRKLPDFVPIEAIDFSAVALVFCCLPHATTQTVLAALPTHLRIIDLSADFRLADPKDYESWYGAPHAALDLQKEAVYGLSEHRRNQIAAARLVANPGCYPTASLLPLLPLAKAGLIDPNSIIIDALSGVSGAGRSLKTDLLFCEVNEGVRAYGVGGHRHVAEMEQEVSLSAGASTKISFTAHLIPMQRGISATIHANLAAPIEQITECLQAAYADEPFVHVCEAIPATHHVRGSNNCLIAVRADRCEGKLIVVSVIDNVVKGASGQAIQNMNVMYGFPETLGLPACGWSP